jgi:hypothetical protein
MARGNVERKGGRRRHAQAVTNHAEQLVVLREALDGMSGEDPAFDDTLSAAINEAADLEGRAKRMSRSGQSRRAACAKVITRATIENTSVMLANERNSNMSSETAPQQYQTGSPLEAASATERTDRYLHLVPALASAALAELPMDERHPHFADWDRLTDGMPMQGV